MFLCGECIPVIVVLILSNRRLNKKVIIGFTHVLAMFIFNWYVEYTYNTIFGLKIIANITLYTNILNNINKVRLVLD